MIDIKKYRKYDPNAETILTGKSGDLIVIDRYGPDDFGAWLTDEEHLYDETYGYSTRGDLIGILSEIRGEIDWKEHDPMKKYTEKQMEQIRSIAFIQMKEGIYLINVPDATGDIDILTPWVEETGRYELSDTEAVEYWGEKIFTDFCEKALAYFADDTVQNRF